MNIQDFKVLVIIPTQRKRPDWLRIAQDSVRFQTMPPFVRVTDKNNEGHEPWSKINHEIRNFKEVMGYDIDAFVVLGDDDYLDPTFIEKTVTCMLKEDVDIVGTMMRVFGEDIKESIHGFHKNPFFTALCKKSFWDKVGGYDENIGALADADFWWMCREAGARVGKVGEPLFNYRVHATNDSKLHDLAACRERVFKKHNAIEWL